MATIAQNGGNLWNPREDRKIYLVWLAVMWLGLIVGFGLDIPIYFLSETPPPSWVTYVHGIILLGWMFILTAQVLLIQSNRHALHRRLGMIALWYLPLPIVSGLATALTRDARLLAVNPAEQDPFLSVLFVDLAAFGLFTVAGYWLRRDPASHKRMMMLAMAAIADPGYERIAAVVLNPFPHSFWPYLFATFYGNFLLVGLMAGWDLWRRGTLNRPFAIGATLLIASYFGATVLYFNPAWAPVTTAIIRAWGYAG